MSRTVSSALVCLGCAASIACDPGAQSGAPFDGGIGSAPSAPDSGGTVAPRETIALVALVQGGVAQVRVDDGGVLTNTGQTVNTPGGIRDIAFTRDGRAVAIAYGAGPANRRGIAIFEISGDRLTPTGDVVIAGPNTVMSLRYPAMNEIVAATMGPDPDSVMVIRRGPSGDWSAGPSVPVGESPQRIYDVGLEGRVMLLRNDIIHQSGSELITLQRSPDGTWEPYGPSTDLTGLAPVDIAFHPEGTTAYFRASPGASINDDAEPTTPNNESRVVTLTAADEGARWTVDPNAFVTAGDSGFLRISRDGSTVAYVDTQFVQRDDGGWAYGYQSIHTLSVDPAGGLEELTGERTLVTTAPDFVFQGVQFAPGGVLLIAFTDEVQGVGTVRSYRRSSAHESRWQLHDELKLDEAVTGLYLAP